MVDDHEFQRKQLKQILESEGYKVIGEADNGQEAISIYDKIGGKNIDLVATDLDMPILDGYALLYELKNRDRDVKIVFVSDDTTKGVIKDLLAMGAIDYILKPLERVSVLDRFKIATRR